MHQTQLKPRSRRSDGRARERLGVNVAQSRGAALRAAAQAELIGEMAVHQHLMAAVASLDDAVEAGRV